MRVLVVDDDPLFLRAIGRRRLEHEGIRFELLLANTVEQALISLDGPPPVDLVLFDICLPEVEDAHRLVDGIVRRAPTRRLVAMSGKAAPEQTFRFGRDGVSAFFTKMELAGLGSELLPTVVQAAYAYTPDLDRLARLHVGATPLRELKRRVVHAMYDEAITRAGGSKRGAAKLLGVQRQAIQRRGRRGDREGA